MKFATRDIGADQRFSKLGTVRAIPAHDGIEALQRCFEERRHFQIPDPNQIQPGIRNCPYCIRESDQRNNRPWRPDLRVFGGEMLERGQRENAISNRPRTNEKAAHARAIMLFNDDRQMNSDCFGPEAHLVIAGLITQLPRHRRWSNRRLFRSLEAGLKIERAGENRERLRTYLDLFSLRIGDRLSRERTARPGKFQRDEELVSRLIVVNVEARQYSNLQGRRNSAAAFHRYLFGRPDRQFTLLREGTERQANQA